MNGNLGNAENFDYEKAQLVGKNIIQSNKNNIVLKKNEEVDIKAWVDYFNLFNEKTAEITYEIIDKEFANIDVKTGKLTAINTGRTTIIVKETGTDKICVIQLLILENSNIEPMVATNGRHTIMLKVDGSVWYYGIEETESNDEPIKAEFPNGTEIIQVAAGKKHYLALDKNGDVWSWGQNNYYQLGNTNENSIIIPNKIEALKNIKRIACGDYNSFAIGSFGEIYAFGLNENGECGVGVYTNRISVTKAKNVSDIIEVKAGEKHTILLKSTGEVFVSGSNLNEELGLDIRKINEFTKLESINRVVMIAAGSMQNMALKTDGSVYTWGTNKKSNLSEIRYISGGKGYNLAINKAGEVFGYGQNATGEFGNSTNTSSNEYIKIETIKDVLGISAGDKHSVIVKQDGTVWATGDYTHGDESIKSKTRGNIWTQVGDDGEGLKETQITLKVGQTIDLTKYLEHEFNLIYLENKEQNLTFETKKAEIANIDNTGNIEGLRTGTTRVIMTDNNKQKNYSVLLKVIPNENTSIVAPKIASGVKFGAVLKSDGIIWAFGNNNKGSLGTGDNLTKDIPTAINLDDQYIDIKAGDNFIIALKEDGTVWGIKNSTLEKIQGLADIQKIACGNNFGMAIDNFGNVYEWEKENLNLNKTRKLGQRIIDISAGSNQRVFVTSAGRIIGFGNILNGEISELNNVVKVAVLNDKIIILTSEGKMLEYTNNQLTDIQINEYVIDIEANGMTAFYQTSDEKIHNMSTNQIRENAFGMGIGKNNTYVIENTGRVYANGDNEYGSLGNGTRNDQSDYILVGDRNFTVEPVTKTMREGDEEEVNIKGNPFNVFIEDTLLAEQYSWDSQNIKIQNPNEQVVRLEVDDTKGIICAEHEGTAKITITDKVTNNKVELTRIVMKQDKDRISKITVNGISADLDETSTDEDIKYRVKVITNEDTGNLIIETTNKTDIISIEEDAKWDEEGNLITDKWGYDGRLEQRIHIPNKETEFEITLGIQNNEGNYPQQTSVKYKLIVEKISDDNTLKKLTVTSKNETGETQEINAKAVSDSRYEVVIDPNTDVSRILGETTSQYSNISIAGKAYSISMQESNVSLDKGITEVNLAVKTEANREKEYTLVIYKANTALELESLKVNDKEAIRISDTQYNIKIPRTIDKANITGILNNNLGQISIDGNEYKIKSNTNQLSMINEQLEIIISAKVEVAGKEYIKEYTLKIIKTSNNADLLKVEVEGEEATIGEDGNYHYSLKKGKQKANVFAKTQEENLALVKIENSEYVLHETNSEIQINKIKTEVRIKVKAEDGTEKEYLLIIDGLPDDVNIEKVIVNEREATYNYEKSRYEVRCKEDEYNIEVILVDKLASLRLGSNQKTQGQDTITIQKTGKETIIEVEVTSQSELVMQTYTIAILEQSQNSNIDTITVNENLVKQNEEGNFYIELINSTSKIDIIAVAEDSYAITTIGANINLSYIAKLTTDVDKENSNYIYMITVTAENGTQSTYELQIKILEANYDLLNVLVGENAGDMQEAVKQEDGNYYYKIGKVEEAYISATTVSDKSSVSINGEEKDVIRVDLLEEITEVLMVVTAEDKTQKEVILIIEKMSSDTGLLSVTGENVIETKIVDNMVYISVDEDLNEVELDMTLKHKLASLKLRNEGTYTVNTIKRTINLANYQAGIGVILNLDVQAEDGTKEEYIINITKQSNLELESVVINETNINYDEQNNKYEEKVSNASKPHIVITAENRLHTVKLLNSSGTVIASGIGILELDATLSTTGLTDQYKIRVVSHNGEAIGSKEYDLVINQKSTETGIIYVKVDNLGTNVNISEKTYSSEVSGKDRYRCRNKTKGCKSKSKNRRFRWKYSNCRARGYFKRRTRYFRW